MKTLFLLSAISLSSSMLSAQSFGEIHGKVFDESRSPMPYVNVVARAGDKLIGKSSDEQGEFKIKPLLPGSYLVEFSFIGYHTHQLQVHVDPEKIRFLPDVVMQANSIIIPDGAVVEALGDQLIDPEETGRMTMRSADFAKSPAAKEPIKLIASMSSEISRDPNSEELYFRGARAGSVQFLIDGIRVHRGINRFPGGAIASVSLYTGGIPAKYGDTTGGIVMIETKNYFDFYNQKIAELSMEP